MQIIQLEVKDDYVENIITLLSSVQDVMIEKFEIKGDFHSKHDPFFIERQKQLHQIRKTIEDGKTKMHDFNSSMDELIKELES